MSERDKIKLTLGIDLAAQNKKTVGCLIDCSKGRAVVREPVTSTATDEDVGWLVDLVCSGDKQPLMP